jgi:cytochrome c553
MQKYLPYIAILIVLLYALYNAKFRTSQKVETKENTQYAKHIKEHKKTHYEDELKKLQTTQYVKQYIISVINHGSNQFDFKGGEMEGGFASTQDAPKIACYVLELSGKKCKEPYAKDAAMFYSSICAGCHGEDGKGLGGTYPDLTKDKLLGIAQREEFLRSMNTHKQ